MCHGLFEKTQKHQIIRLKRGSCKENKSIGLVNIGFFANDWASFSFQFVEKEVKKRKDDLNQEFKSAVFRTIST